MAFNLTLCTVYNTPFKEVADLTVPVMQEYCARHGYRFYHRLCDEPKRDIIWERLEVVKEAMEAGPCGQANVLWVDADVLLTNHEKDLSWLESATYAVTFLKTESGAYRLNDGLFYWCQWMLQNVQNLALMEPDPQRKLFCPQDFIERAFFVGHEFMSPVPPRHWQSIINSEYGITDAPEQEWRQGNFALHLPGRANERRVELLKQHIPLIVR